MNPPTTEQPAATPLSTAVNAVDAAVEDLIKTVEADALSGVGAFSLVELLQQIETVRNKLPSVDRAMIQYGAEQGVPSVLSCRTMRQVLTGSSGCPQVRRTGGSRPPATSPTGTRCSASRCRRSGRIWPPRSGPGWSRRSR